MKQLTYTSLLLLFSIFFNTTRAQQNLSDTARRYIKTPTGYFMVLRQDDDVLKQLEDFATQENIPAASFTGMGFVNVKFGFFNFKTKEYEPKEFKDVELASMRVLLPGRMEKFHFIHMVWLPVRILRLTAATCLMQKLAPVQSKSPSHCTIRSSSGRKKSLWVPMF